MIKTMYFGEVPQEYLAMGTEDLFVFKDKFFYYMLEFDVEEGTSRLTDTCGRSLPFDMTSYEEMAFAFDKLHEIQEDYNDIQSELSSFNETIPEEMCVAAVDE